MKKPITKKRLRELVVKQVDRDARAGIVECLRAGYPAIAEKYGHHSSEGRAVEALIKTLESA